MLKTFPRQIANKAIITYVLALTSISIIFSSFRMAPVYIILGIAWVLLFFLLSSKMSEKWQNLERKKYIRKLFVTALSLRLIWVIFSYFFYTFQTGIPFEFGSSDAYEYHSAAEWMLNMGWSGTFDYLSTVGLSDSGYPLYLTALYHIIGPNVFLTRVMKSIMSAYMCVLMYKFTERNFGESVGRLAGIFGCFMPNLIIYCGLHLKETEMIFLTIACIERTDNLLHKKSMNAWNVIFVILLLGSLFAFRTVLGATMFFSILSAILFYNKHTVSTWNRIILIIWALTAVAILAGGRIASEVQGVWNDRGDNQAQKRSYQMSKGIEWAKYATGTVMAPMMFVVPFPTMVDVDKQYNQQIVHAGNYVRNFMGIFVLIAVYSAFFRKKNWRNYALVGSFAIAYLAVICSSGFSNSERFLLPALPMLLIIAANGINELSIRNIRFVKYWYFIVFAMAFSWAFFKLGSRGIL